eukprot:766389-Hanusia_phi.AAC.7
MAGTMKWTNRGDIDRWKNDKALSRYFKLTIYSTVRDQWCLTNDTNPTPVAETRIVERASSSAATV